MPYHTQDVLELVQDVLATFSKPYHEDVIEDVFVAIERHPEWLKRYTALKARHKKDVPNNYIGYWTKRLTGYETVAEVPTTRTQLAKSYSKLRAP